MTEKEDVGDDVKSALRDEGVCFAIAELVRQGEEDSAKRIAKTWGLRTTADLLAACKEEYDRVELLKVYGDDGSVKEKEAPETEERYVRCNRCMRIAHESELNVDKDTEQEHCPRCGASDALMDLERVFPVTIDVTVHELKRIALLYGAFKDGNGCHASSELCDVCPLSGALACSREHAWEVLKDRYERQ